MKPYLTQQWYLRTFTITQMNGALMRLNKIEALINDIPTITDCLSVHKEMAKEGFLTADIDVSDPSLKTGMFRASSVEAMTPGNVFMGMADNSDYSISILDVEIGNLTDSQYDKMFKQYKDILRDAIADIRKSVQTAKSKAMEEYEKIMEDKEAAKTEGVGRRMLRGFISLVGIPQNKTVYPVDLEHENKSVREQIRSYLRHIEFPEHQIAGILSGGFEASLLIDLAEVERGVDVVFKTVSEEEKIALAESSYRSILKTCAGMASVNDHQFNFSNYLPIQCVNGRVFTGYSQFVLRLAMEIGGPDQHALNIPVVLDMDEMYSIGMEPREGSQGIYLCMENRAGEVTGRRYWFLEDTDLPEVNPGLYETLLSTFGQLNYRAMEEKASGADYSDFKSYMDNSFYARSGVESLVYDVLVPEFGGDVVKSLDFKDVGNEVIGYETDPEKILHNVLVGDGLKNSILMTMLKFSTNLLYEGRRLCHTPRQGINLAVIDRLNSKVQSRPQKEVEEITLDSEESMEP